jgi:hypothetical protein
VILTEMLSLLLWLLLVILLLLAWILFVVRKAIVRSMGQPPRFTTADDAQLLPESERHVEALLGAGFEPLGAPFFAELGMRLLVVAFVHRDRALLASVTEQQGLRKRVLVDLVTTFRGGTMLTTCDAWEAGCMPLPPGRLLQIAPGGDVAGLLALHLQGVAVLQAEGQAVESTAHATLATAQASMAGCFQGFVELLRRAPWRSAWIVLGRTVRRRSPHGVPLAEQRRLGPAAG